MLSNDLKKAAVRLGIKQFRDPNIIGMDDDVASRAAVHDVFRDSKCVRNNVRAKACQYGYTDKTTTLKKKQYLARDTGNLVLGRS